jgi:cobalamin biosynthesis Mg chelatase CobN
MNRVDFAPENALVKNGILVLALTKENAMGYAGTPPADEPVSSSSASSVAVSSSVASSNAASSAAASSTPASSKAASSTATTGSNPGGGGGSVPLWGLLALGGLLLARCRK